MNFAALIILIAGLWQLIYAYIPANAVDHEYSNDTDKSSHLQLYGDVRGFEDGSISLQMSGEDTNGTTSGFIVHFSEQNATSQPATDSPWLAFISCDANSTDSTEEYDIFSFAADRGARAVLLYTTTKERCQINPVFLQTYNRVIDVFATSTRDSARLIDNQFDVNSTYYWYNSQSINDTARAIQQDANTRNPYLLATLSAYNATQAPTNPDQGDPGTQQEQDNPSNTSLAMIILYVIIAVVTILFIIVILSGAFRAVRNPQRYGERPATRQVMDTVTGQTVVVEDRGQTRAGGIARAILETFPLVNFNNEPKMRQKGANDGGSESTGSPDIEMGEANANTSPDHPSKETTKEGVAVAADESQSQSEDDDDSPQNCPICYEDFEQGEQLRLLPCNEKHCFHAKCIDPWLLEVQGVCPLCRQDFRDPAAQPLSAGAGNESTTGSVDQSNTTTTTDTTQFPPYTTAHLTNTGRRQSLRSVGGALRVSLRRQRRQTGDGDGEGNGEGDGGVEDNADTHNDTTIHEADITENINSNDATNNNNNTTTTNDTANAPHTTNDTSDATPNDSNERRTDTSSRPLFNRLFKRQKNTDGSDRV